MQDLPALTPDQHRALLHRLDDLEAACALDRPNTLTFIAFWILWGLLWGLLIGWLVWG